MDENQPQQEDLENADNNESLENEWMYIYEWVDSIPLSKPKKNIARDFNDGVLLAEMIKYHYPNLVDLHNYPNVSSMKQKQSNWSTWNKKVLKKLGLKISQEEFDNVMNSRPNAIEGLLIKVYRAINGMPQDNQPNKNNKAENETENENNPKRNLKTGNSKIETDNQEELRLKEKIIEKDQEILALKEHIENWEIEINESNARQTNLENTLKEWNEIIRKNEIDI